nr:hypothetical protein Iba_chr08eCG3640 [Ipomoea batatas]
MEKVIGGKQTRLIDFVLEDVRLAVGFPVYGVDSTNVFITSIEDIYKKKEDGVVSDNDGSSGLDAMYKEMEKDKIVDLGDSDGASSSEQANVPLKRCLIDEFDRVGGTSKKAKEIVVKLEKM